MISLHIEGKSVYMFYISFLRKVVPLGFPQNKRQRNSDKALVVEKSLDKVCIYSCSTLIVYIFLFNTNCVYIRD